MKVAYDPIYAHPLPEGHRFPMEKYELLHTQLLYEGVCDPNDFFTPEKRGFDEHILAVHQSDYVQKLLSLSLTAKEIRKIGFPLSELLIEREFQIANGTYQATRIALDNGIAMNIAGGTHHSYADRGEAFCLLNDQAIGANYLIQSKLSKKVLIVDLDVHQGNGTAKIFENEDRVFTFSMHGANNYPFKKEKSDLDIALDNDTGDDEYLTILEKTLKNLINNEKPDFIYYLTGVDVLKTDKLGKLGMTIDGCRRRDEIVFSQCSLHGLPIMCSMGGGYSIEIRDIIDAHANTFKEATKYY